MADDPWLNYTNVNATRNLPLSDRLQGALGFLPELGVTVDVFSGGQPTAGNGARVGSERHDHGDAADVFFYKDGKRLDWANPEDQPLFEEIVRRGKAAGLTGFGAGPGYMQPGSMHVGFGSPSVWGAGGKAANAPAWLKSAYFGAPLAPAPVAAINTAIMAPAKRATAAVNGAVSPIMRAVQGGTGAIMQAARIPTTIAGRTAAIDPIIKSIMTGSPSGVQNTSVVQSYRDRGASPSQAYDAANRAATERAIMRSSDPERARNLNRNLGNI